MNYKSKAFWLTLTLLFLSTGPGFAAEVASSEIVGKYGFDWLKPETTKCLAITDKLLLGAKPCQYQDAHGTGSFSGKADFYICKLSAKSEYMVYKTQARCTEELETMRANGP